MTDNTSRHNEHSGRRQVFAWLFPLALFPLVALLSYDWRAVETINVPARHSTNWVGALGDCFAYYGYLFFGLAIWAVPIWCIAKGIGLIVGHKMNAKRNGLWFLLLLASLSCLMQVLGNHAGWIADTAESINICSSGGAIGYLMMTRFLSPLLNDFGSSVLMTIVMLVALVGAIGPHNIAKTFKAIIDWATAKRDMPESYSNDNSFDDNSDQAIAYREAMAAKEAARIEREEEKRLIREEKQRIKEEKQRQKEAQRAAREAEKQALQAAKDRLSKPMPMAYPPKAASVVAPPQQQPVQDAIQPQQANESTPSTPEDKGPYILPSLSLLNPIQQSTADHGDVGEMTKRLIDTLKLFGVDAQLSYTVQGPVVTKYALSLAPGTRYSSVTNIEANLKGAMRAKSLRIEAPIPGEDHVGIEVPNRTAAGISFREIIESDTWKSNVQSIGGKPAKFQLPLLFGKDAAGRDLVADLATMPHMLVAGATGQGKSVCLNAIINGLLMTKTPEQLKLIMVDPKSVEFTPYASIPHLIVPVITDNKKVVFSLHWAVAEMEKRLKLFARARCRNIMDFNYRKSFTQTDMFGNDTEVGSGMPKTIPYIVIIIDEVADLMSTSAKEVVPDISRLTAKARAAGIHLILATQRPDAKVITGTIKANIPGRVAFKTATGIDSRTILDEGGAENLIGRGDMLFKSKDGQLIRAQGAWISDPEIERITDFIQQHANQQFDERFAKKLGSIKEAEIDPFADADDDNDDQDKKADAEAARAQVKAEENASDFKKAVECIINTHRASTSHFQRKLGWGYNHSAKIIDMLEEAGVIGPQTGSGPRQITMDQQELLAVFNGGNSESNAMPEGDAQADESFENNQQDEPPSEEEI